MIVSSEEMRRIEERAFASGSSPETLMEQAGAQVAGAVRQFFPRPGRARIYFGKGHNGGDALVAARHLAASGWRIEPYPVFPEKDWSALTRKKFAELGNPIHPKNSEACGKAFVVLDGLLGIGVAGGLREPIRSAAAEINRLRREENAFVFAVDLPTGLDTDTGAADSGTVVADFTLTIGCCKTGLIADAAASFVGRLAVLPLPELAAPPGDGIATPDTLRGLVPRREFESHKTRFGRVALVAGSVGFTGAAVLAGEAALRAGAGLVTLYVKAEAHAAAASAAAPEIMVKPIRSLCEPLEESFDVLGIGPGLGTDRRDELLEVLKRCEKPMVVDADALNMLAGHLDVLRESAGPRLLTPHPGEMKRLSETAGQTRREIAGGFVEKWPVTLLLKGARTTVAERGRPFSYNSTGNPGMGTGGMGDVLTGVGAALIGQHLSPYDAARAGAWLCGRAAEIAMVQGGRSQESLAASDVIAFLGSAFDELRAGTW